MARDQKALTYRVRQLPPEIDKAGVVSTVQQHLQEDKGFPEVRIYSLAQDLSSFHTSRTKTATVTIDPLPSYLEGRGQWDFLTTYRGLEYNIIIDLNFLDFTVLNEVRDEQHVLDCVAISGLGSHPFGSWQHRGEGPFMWLRDGVPRDIPGVRSIIYGYDSLVPDSKSFQRPHDIAARFVNRLRSVGFGSSQSRPVIFLAHSLGGIILKESLIILAGISDQQHSVLENLKLVIFFGVPHKGMSTSRLVTMVKGQPNENLVRDLSPGSSYLFHVEERFNGIQIRRAYRVVSFYETKTTKTVQQDDHRKWSRSGPEIRMVDRESAIQQCSRDPEDIYSIDEDHSAMVKFSPGDFNYKCVLDALAAVMSMLESDDGKNMTGSTCSLGDDLSERERLPTNAEVPTEPVMRSLERTRAISPEEIISSLRLEILNRRRAEVSYPYKSTFDWIFNNEILGFTTWLLKGKGVYWIKGKPGSGKSTLMKHITQHQYTHDFLSRWSHPAQPITGEFFFYYRGSKIQKSFDGLVRSILLQILVAMPQLCQFIPQECLSQRQEQRLIWSQAKLNVALQSVLAHRPGARKVCLFIDALDEFDGHLEVLADFIGTLIREKCKVCFSSRPRDILEKHFGLSPGISIHNHTKTDIQNYTMARLANLPGLQDPSHVPWEMRNTVNNAANEVRRKANGVFLWVKLALDRIERDGVIACRLSEQLQELPAELEDFYLSIIERIPHEFRWEIYIALDVMLRAQGQLSSLRIFQIAKCIQCQTLEECFDRTQETDGFFQFCLHLKEHCGGLVEIPEPFNTDGRIRLMHETVREFIGGSRFQEVIVGPAATFNAQNGYTELSKLCLTDLKYRNNFGTDWRRLVKSCMLYCHLAESTTGVCQFELIDALQPVNFKDPKDESDTPRTGLATSPVDFAVRSGLLIYMQQKLAKSEDWKLIAEEALYNVVQTIMDLDMERGWPLRSLDFDQYYMAEVILEGTSSQYAGGTAFGSLLFPESKPSHPRYSDELGTTVRVVQKSKAVLDLAQIFLDNGQDPNVEMIAQSAFAAKPCGSPKGPRPLHVAFNEMARLLLSYSAEINARDRAGRTPLDVALQKVVFGWRPNTTDLSYEYKDYQLLIMDHIDMLIGEGGCITREGFRFYPSCIAMFRGARRNLEALLNLPRVSVKNGFLSKLDLHVVPIVSRVEVPIRRLIARRRHRDDDYV